MEERTRIADQREARHRSFAACIGAWLATFAATAVAFEVWVPHASGKGGIRALAHLHSLGLHFALGLALGTLVDAARLVRPPRMRFLAATLFAALLGALVAEEDMRGFAELIPGPIALWSHAIGAGLGVASPVAFVVGRRAAHDWRARLGACAFALGLAVAHHRLLTSGYEAVHFTAVSCAASLLAGVLDRWRVLDRIPRPGARASAALTAIAALVATASVILDPGSNVVVLSRRLPGNAVPALAAQARQLWRQSSSPRLARDSPWLKARAGLPPTAPSGLSPLPKDGIVILLTIDAVRADIMKPPHIARFPNFARLDAASVSLPRARSAAPHTTPSLSALMMGRYYSTIRWSRGKAKHPKPYDDKSPTIAEVLAERRIESAAYPALRQISEEYGLGRGFTEPAKRTNGAAKIFQAIVRRLKKRSPQGLFIYSHLMEPHAPYDGSGDTAFERYLGEVAQVDAALGKLLDVVLDSDLEDRTVLIVSADHGEAFGEHDSKLHGGTLYEELIRVPMWIYIPGVAPGSSNVAASLVDIGPTIMDLFRAPVPSTFMGQSLLPALLGKGPPPDRPLVMESGRMMRAIIEDDRWKFIEDRRHGTLELYDLERDPHEVDNLYDTEPERAARLVGFLNAFFDAHSYRAKGYELPYYP